MTGTIKALNAIKSVLFGKWNGLQVFLVPTTVLFLIDDNSLRLWFLGLFTRQLFYIPLIMFLLLFLFLVFLIIKQSVALEAFDLIPEQRTKWLYDYILGIHELLLVIIFSFMVVYVLTAFLRYFYSIQLPLHYIYLKIFQFMAIGLILYQHLRNYWLKHTMKSGRSPKRSIAVLLLYIRHHRREFYLHTLMLCGLILVSVHVYKWVVYLFLEPFAMYLDKLAGMPVRFTVARVRTPLDLLYNVFVLFCAYIVSNLLFAPVINLFHHLSLRIKPRSKQLG
ncbi:MAG: hypothetical protein FJ042_05880 [Candidatus Cloacimonetes bacterium]|nr:hypothetical protein [Candidatus Cloacimonadota bacterium]